MALVCVNLQLLGRLFSELFASEILLAISSLLVPDFFRNSGWMYLSYPGALPLFMFLIAASTSSGEMGLTL